MKLRELLATVPQLSALSDAPNLEKEVTAIVTNSHQCQGGELFIGLPGTRVDGGDFWRSAIAAGAIAAIITPDAAKRYPPTSEFSVFVIENINDVYGQLASAFYNHPSQQLKLVGVTGTNGKTTTTHLIEFFLSVAKKSTALFGTLYARWQGYNQVATHTTPFPAELQAQLATALSAGNEYAVLEVSSHALAQGRVKGCAFEVAVFTNLTQDHLDFHETMENYFQAKALLFRKEYLRDRAIINQDDPYGQRLIQELATEKVWRYSRQDTSADLYTENLVYEASGVQGTLKTPQGEITFRSPLVGEFNLSNLLAAVGAALHLGVELETIAQALPNFTGVPGRMERVVVAPSQDISVIVDYAHTPDSLENLLRAARPFIPQRLICVFGCGGDRDRTKRPLMGKIASDLADVPVVTSDNPRTEDPQQIIEDILEGMANAETIVQRDRAVAIASAIAMAQPGDGVLIAGKGHEDYQILGTEKVHFDDREEARKGLEKRLS
ncbi:UDP-N-acetylmuramoylalanyl-D-glutamate--2,6-diaminopimelate ligase [Halothece sp. PCC 7418]|uniref:UDP-N-acetylmuramoyl-L-alanyl-D-glutamate--2,6-diaminopimelate ligase n=1 Tax=Aphanothece halophytica TaxID=72020 RepID=A0A5A4TQE8_APHHA|nr:UDP-N-acetylmuramoyl-L-alanyl-D-glutamate--2,6-diaminopimelate ligase [Halothece sp. PCC 7418]AFZ42323.1 UDP-N-acetylmuramoylalanyl-D-glutamate--2,6-diaminopimelate ligase [Halothece sp. PCC 7418]BBK63513.1 UDP-N-acetyl-alpha-D-muramoyl-L-alanyl-gamma-D-glutamyl-meso-2,6-diaminoheptanedioate [Aphanothece halophytica]